MDTITLAKADYLDILFENRNKQYGSYKLRRHYNQRTLTSLGIVVALSGALALYGSLGNRTHHDIVTDISHAPIHMTEVHIDMPKVQVEPPKTIVTPPAAKPTVASVDYKVVDDIKVTTPPPTVDDLVNKDPGVKTVAGNTNANTNTTIKGGTGTIPVVSAPSTTPVTWSEVMPQFNGNINDFLAKELRYPERAKDMGIEGKVTVQFVVNEDGSVSSAHIVKGLGGDCDAEALRVINIMPKWKPGLQNGKPVKVYYTLPIRFLLQ